MNLGKIAKANLIWLNFDSKNVALANNFSENVNLRKILTIFFLWFFFIYRKLCLFGYCLILFTILETLKMS